MPLSRYSVQEKAKSLFQDLKECAGEDYTQELVAKK